MKSRGNPHPIPPNLPGGRSHPAPHTAESGLLGFDRECHAQPPAEVTAETLVRLLQHLRCLETRTPVAGKDLQGSGISNGSTVASKDWCFAV